MKRDETHLSSSPGFVGRLGQAPRKPLFYSCGPLNPGAQQFFPAADPAIRLSLSKSPQRQAPYKRHIRVC
jgi:hypothetical protein